MFFLNLNFTFCIYLTSSFNCTLSLLSSSNLLESFAKDVPMAWPERDNIAKNELEKLYYSIV